MVTLIKKSRKMKQSISIIIAALNEEGNLAAAVNATLTALGDRFSSYELLIIDDGSTDATGTIADRLAIANPNIKVVHNGRNMGLGYSFRRGIELATKEYIGWFPGDNDMDGKSLEDLLDLIGRADIVVPYMANPWCRPLSRRIISRSFTTTMNVLFGLKLRYYNGPAIHRSKLIKATSANTTGYAFLAEVLVRLIKAGHTWVEVATYHRRREHGISKAFRLKNILSVLMTVWRLVWDIHVRQRKRSASPYDARVP